MKKVFFAVVLRDRKSASIRCAELTIEQDKSKPLTKTAFFAVFRRNIIFVREHGTFPHEFPYNCRGRIRAISRNRQIIVIQKRKAQKTHISNSNVLACDVIIRNSKKVAQKIPIRKV